MFDKIILLFLLANASSLFIFRLLAIPLFSVKSDNAIFMAKFKFPPKAPIDTASVTLALS